MVVFERVRFKNFKSYGNQFTEVVLNKSNTTAISGGNGQGKSSILLSIEYALFGRVSSGSNKNELVNTINGKDCLIELEFSVDNKKYFVRRGIKPNVFEIFEDGKLIDQTASSKDYQLNFEQNILGFDLPTFKQVISISGASYQPFMLLSAGARRKLVEDLLDLTIFTKMNDLHRAGMVKHREALSDIEGQIDRTKASLKSLKLGLEKVKSKDAEYREAIIHSIEVSRNEVEALNSGISLVNQEIENANASIASLNSLKTKSDKLRAYKRDIAGKISTIDRFLDFVDGNVTCPTCTQELTDEYKQTVKEEREQKRNTLSSSLSQLESVIEETQSKLDEYQQTLQAIQRKEREIVGLQSRISQIQSTITKAQKQLDESGETEEQELQSEIKRLAREGDLLVNKRLDLLEQRHYNELVLGIIKDSGLKSSVIKKYIPLMNKSINKYLELLDLNVSFVIDENFNERILSRFKDDLSYHSFSAGERARIDISMLFTWREIAKQKNSLNCNLLFLDEVFDSQMDSTGLEQFINLLSFHLPGTNAFLISHRPEVQDKLSSSIRIEKVGNFSKIV